MLTVMEMSTGKIIQDEFGTFEDEVLNAGWLPPLPEVQLGLQEVQPERASGAAVVNEFDADAYIHQVYVAQE
jgi:hypothetical protein